MLWRMNKLDKIMDWSCTIRQGEAKPNGCIIHCELFALPICGEACKHYCCISDHLTVWRISDCPYHYIASFCLDKDSTYLFK